MASRTSVGGMPERSSGASWMGRIRMLPPRPSRFTQRASNAQIRHSPSYRST